MRPDSKSAVFRRLADLLRVGCERRGIHLDDGAAEVILADHINTIAAQLGITDHYAMRTFVTDETIGEIVVLVEQAHYRQQAEIDLASPVLLPIPHAATIIGALAASCQAATTAVHRADATAAVVEATSAILHIAVAIARADDTGHAILDAATAVNARTRLSTMLEHLTDGTWYMPGHQRLPDSRKHDLAMRDRIARDLELLQ